MTTIKVIGFIVVLAVVAGVLSVVGVGCHYCNRTAQVVMQETDPAVLLKKYGWFKDASSALDKKIADIGVMEVRIKYIESLGDKATRSDREQMYVWMSEISGIKASYNQLASEYNSQMAKINWAFTNVGDLPKGATVELPREYKPYMNN